VNVVLVPVHVIDQIWPKVAEGFEDAIHRTGGDVALGDLWTQARSGRAFLFVAIDGDIRGASLWRFETWASGPKFRCLALYGENMADWFADMERAVRAAAGSARLVTEGRRGWAKMLPNVRELRTLYEEIQ
jgi:hypothetical protein